MIVKKMKPALKEQYDILATEMDKLDKAKIAAHNFYKKYGYVPKQHETMLAAFLADNCKPWREIPKARKTILKAAKKSLKNIKAASK